MKKAIKMIAAAAIIGSVIASSSTAMNNQTKTAKNESSLVKKATQ